MLPLLATALAKVAAAAPTPTTVPLAAQKPDHSIFAPIAKPIADVLAAFYSIIPNYGVAIILLSLAWMILIAPLTLKSTRSMLAMQKLQPQLKKLQAEHKNDRAAFAAAQMELFKEHNVSPFGSCLPTLLPLPVFFALFRVIDGLSHHVKVNGKLYPDPNFLSPHTQMYKAIYAANGHINAFGIDLAKNALSSHSSFAAAVPYFVLLLIMIGTQYLQTVQMMSRNPAANDNPQMKMMKYLPIFFGVICVRFPAGVILYYAMSNICRMAQQTLMYRYDPKVRALAAREVIEVEALTRDIDRRAAGGSGGSGGAAGSGARSPKKPAGGSGGAARPAKAADTAPARNSRFRDALAQASKQAAEGRAKKTAEVPTPAAKAKPSGNARPVPAKGRPATAATGTPPQPARTRNRNPATGNKASGAARVNAAATPAPGAPRPVKPDPKVAAPTGSAGPDGNRTTPDTPVAANGNGNGSGTSNGKGRPGGAATNGNGTSAPSGATKSPPDQSPAGAPNPPRNGAGRTGASQSRTPRKRRGR